jgi:CBS domain-containing protein
MNVAFFLTPKQNVEWISSRSTVRQALERMAAHSFSAVPLLDDEGRYVGTVTEGDLLWFLKASDRPWREVGEETPVLSIKRAITNEPVGINAEVEALIARSIGQNFVPVVDDRQLFVGIVRRRHIIEYCARRIGMLAVT